MSIQLSFSHAWEQTPLGNVIETPIIVKFIFCFGGKRRQHKQIRTKGDQSDQSLSIVYSAILDLSLLTFVITSSKRRKLCLTICLTIKNKEMHFFASL